MLKAGATFGNLVPLSLRRWFHRKEGDESAGSVFLGSYVFVNGTLAREWFCFFRVMPTAKLSHWRPRLLQIPSLL